MQRGIDDGIPPATWPRLNLAVAGYIIVTILAYIFGRLQVRAVATEGEGFLRNLRVRVFDHIQRSRWRSSTATRPACSCRG